VSEIGGGMTSLEQVIQLAESLEPREQLRLVAHISDRLSQAPPPAQPDSKAARHRRKREAVALLRELDQAALSGGTMDSAETIRRMRDERHQQLWPNK
jgi:hypothetical protein